MKASEYVQKIQELIEEHGDVEVQTLAWTYDLNNPQEPYFMKKDSAKSQGIWGDGKPLRFSYPKKDCIILDD